MSAHDRKEDEVRRMLGLSHPQVPPELAARAADRGRGILRARRAVGAVVWVLLLIAVVAFWVWAAIEQPWSAPPRDP
ncbi:hypothetical protein ACFY41_19630 [Streptomyces syringium]|uniref:Ferric-dicitrate binding protein FerR (Iron transport regulator) n=1 Tax=Streptomyces syringium TaxID=76729 RepID=A0ABS4Y7Q7_9ACTN|nr:hypothetical protein [Streptomyces syringium]MBP2404822.1 ferric-dicitrate binding protein FerR (iron transport regulator) [Streptomyces syringium]